MQAYGIRWVEYNFFGPTKIYQRIRKIASYFDDYIKEKSEKVIEKYKPMMGFLEKIETWSLRY